MFSGEKRETEEGRKVAHQDSKRTASQDSSYVGFHEKARYDRASHAYVKFLYIQV